MRRPSRLEEAQPWPPPFPFSDFPSVLVVFFSVPFSSLVACLSSLVSWELNLIMSSCHYSYLLLEKKGLLVISYIRFNFYRSFYKREGFNYFYPLSWLSRVIIDSHLGRSSPIIYPYVICPSRQTRILHHGLAQPCRLSWFSSPPCSWLETPCLRQASQIRTDP